MGLFGFKMKNDIESEKQEQAHAERVQKEDNQFKSKENEEQRKHEQSLARDKEETNRQKIAAEYKDKDEERKAKKEKEDEDRISKEKQHELSEIHKDERHQLSTEADIKKAQLHEETEQNKANLQHDILDKMVNAKKEINLKQLADEKDKFDTTAKLAETAMLEANRLEQHRFDRIQDFHNEKFKLMYTEQVAEIKRLEQLIENADDSTRGIYEVALYKAKKELRTIRKQEAEFEETNSIQRMPNSLSAIDKFIDYSTSNSQRGLPKSSSMNKLLGNQTNNRISYSQEGSDDEEF